MAYISKTNFAKKHGFSKQYVSELLREGVLQEESNGMLDEGNADYALSLKQQTRGNKSKLQELFLKAKLQNELERGKLLKLETAEKERSLIPVEKVKDTLYKKGRTVRESFMRLLDRVASTLEMQDRATIHMVLTREIRSIIDDLTCEDD